MSRVRLLFAPENTGFADKLAVALAQSGYDPSTDDDPASAALVVWSQASAASKPILSAARSALARRVLVPVALGKTPPPPSFEHLWPMDLAGWNGRPDDPRWKFVLDELELATRRGVVFRPAAANDRGAPPRTEIPVEAPPAAPLAPPATPAEDRLAEPVPRLFADERVETIRPRPKFPKIAVGAGFAVAALAGAGVAALMIGVSDGRRATSAKDDPVVAFVAPPRREAVALEPEITAAPTGTIDPSTDELREGDADRALDHQHTDDLAAVEESAPALATPALTEPVSAAPETAPVEALPAIPAAAAEAAEADPIAGLAWSATGSPGEEKVSYGRYLRDCVDCPDLAEIDAGSFLMGAAAGDAGAHDFEGPQTPVTLTRALAMSVREVTYDDWRPCALDNACPPLTGAGKVPVVNATYDEAETYAAWLSAKTGRRYRVPSEAEWEYAAQAGADATNAFGLERLLSGVREWTADCWSAGHAGRPGDGRAVGGAVGGACQMRVVKGGSGLRAAARDAASGTARSKDVGFRVVRDLY